MARLFFSSENYDVASLPVQRQRIALDAWPAARHIRKAVSENAAPLTPSTQVRATHPGAPFFFSKNLYTEERASLASSS